MSGQENSAEAFAQMRTATREEWKQGLLHRDPSLSWTRFLPDLPGENIQRRFVGKAFSDAFEEAHDFIEFSLESAKTMGFEHSEIMKVADLGCGWGRIIQALYRYFLPENIYGIDIQQEAIDICSKTGVKANLSRVDTGQSAFPDNAFDMMTAYSVFSHLSLENHLKWLEEIKRVVKPGGIVAVTTRGPAIIKHVQNLRRMDSVPDHARGLIEAFEDSEIAMEQYSNGQYVYRDYPYETSSGSGYGEALIPEKYLQDVWTNYFSECQLLTPGPTITQKVILCRV